MPSRLGDRCGLLRDVEERHSLGPLASRNRTIDGAIGLMFQPSLPPERRLQVAQIIQLAVARCSVAGVGAFLNVCASRLARIVDRARGSSRAF